MHKSALLTDQASATWLYIFGLQHRQALCSPMRRLAVSGSRSWRWTSLQIAYFQAISTRCCDPVRGSEGVKGGSPNQEIPVMQFLQLLKGATSPFPAEITSASQIFPFPCRREARTSSQMNRDPCRRTLEEPTVQRSVVYYSSPGSRQWGSFGYSR